MSSSIPETCKAVVIEKAGAPWTIKQVPVKTPEAGEILVKVQACGVCHSDSAVQAGHFGAMVTYPIIPGHEIIGKVAKVGPGEQQWKVGDSIGGAWHGGQDNTCKACRRGLLQMCDNKQANGVTRNGGYTEYCILRSEAAVRVPSDVDPAENAPLLCAGVTVFNSIRNMNIKQGDLVAVQGLGGLGHLAVQYSRKMGYRTVALSTSDDKKDFALNKLGANDFINTKTENAAERLLEMGGASLIVLTAPNPEAVPELVGGCGVLGKVLTLAAMGPVSVDTIALIGKGISVHGWPSGAALDSEEAIDFARKHDVRCMVEKFPLDKVEDAVNHMLSNKVRFRAVLTME